MDVDIGEVKNIDPIRIKEVSSIEALRIQTISNISNIDPLAAHIKEVNHIDPISIEALHIRDVRNIEPINVERFNVTNLPTVNLSVRQLPSLDMNVRRIPPVSLGTHQDFDIPSNYTIRARFLGIEFFRIHLDGQSKVVPRERARREQARVPSRSFPETAVAGNPAIPSVHREESTRVHYPASHHHPGPAPCISQGGYASQAGSLHFGQPVMTFGHTQPHAVDRGPGSSVSSGG